MRTVNVTEGRRAHEVACFMLAMCAALVVTAGAQAQQPPAPVFVDAVRMESVQEQRKVTGELRAVSRSRVATLEPGLVTSLPVQEGQRVSKGDTLATLDSRSLAIERSRVNAQLDVAQAVIDEREAQVDLSRNDRDVLLEMEQKGAGRPKELRDAESEVHIAEARLLQAKRDVDVLNDTLALLDKRIADMTIAAPFDGVIIEKHSEVGQWAGEGDPIVEIVSTGSYDAWLSVPQTLTRAVMSTDASVHMLVDATRHEQTVSSPRVVRRVDQTARTIQVIARIDDKDDVLAPGMSITGWVPTGGTAEHLTIMKDAIMQGPTGFYVYVARSTGDHSHGAFPAAIDVLFEVGRKAVIRTQELKPGDMIVVEGNERLYPTAAIIPRELGSRVGSQAKKEEG